MTAVNRADINNVLLQMRSLRSQMQNQQELQGVNNGIQNPGIGGPEQVQKTNPQESFTQVFKDAINNVNEVQKASGEAAKAFQMGDPNVDISDVMIASQKSSISTQALIQVRNRLVSAYEDIMKMPV